MIKSVGKELEDRAAIHIAARTFDALAAAHSATDDAGLMAPVIHRDVNPSNVLVGWDGHVKLADFGVAKVTGMDHQSVAGMIKGTYGYMAPEQVTGELVTPRADVYAGGIILWELLTKRRAFQRGALPEMEALRTMAEPRLTSLDTLRPDVDRSIRDAVKRALEPRPERRMITAEEMVSILTSVVPADEGRERLVAALGLVRNDARAAAAAAIPSGDTHRPPMTVPDPRTVPALVAPPNTLQGLPPPPPASSSASRGMLPKAVAPPRPESVARMAAAAPARPAAEPPKLPSRTALPAATAPSSPKAPGPAKVPSRMLPATTLQSAPSSAEPAKRPSASARLAVAVPDASRDSKPIAAGSSSSVSPSSVSLFDSLVEAPEITSARAGRDPLRLGTPLESVTAGLALKDAIDEILRGQPSSMPPSVLRESGSVPAVIEPARAASNAGAVTAVMPEAPRHIGQLPAAPAPMRVGAPGSRPLGTSPAKPRSGQRRRPSRHLQTVLPRRRA
jgi:serine/threonine-protein kinase